MQPKLGIVGYFGYNNLGDEWFIRTWQQLFSGFADIHVVHPLESVCSLDGIIIGGGDLVFPHHVNNNYFREELFQKPYWIYGVGVTDGPWRRPAVKQYYHRVFGRAQAVYVRDELSREIVRNEGLMNNVKVAPDLAWAGPLPTPIFKPGFSDESDGQRGHGRWLGISVRPAPMYERKAFCETVACLARDLNYKCIAIPLQPSDVPGLSDFNEHQEIVANLNSSSGTVAQIAPPDLKLSKRLSMIGTCSLYITLRFHGLIAGMRYRIPTVALVRPQTIKFQAIRRVLGDSVAASDMGSLDQRVRNAANSSFSYEDRVHKIESQARVSAQRFRETVLATLR